MKKTINGLSYHVEMCGEGFSLMALHGYTGAASTWKPFCPVWGTHASVIIPDFPGHGQTDSPADEARYEIEKIANDLRTLLDELEIEKTDLLGYSMGGRVAITFASLYPQRVRKLVLESTTPGIEDALARELRRQNDSKLAARIEAEGVEKFVDYWESIPLFQSQLNLPDHVREQIRNQRMLNNPQGLANSLRGMGTGRQPSWWDKLGSFPFETLLITGTLDEKFEKIAEKMASRLPKAKHVSIEGSGHAIHVEHAEKFGTIVSEFLSNT
ncbi:2-succinyl-6-hydroxy-2,4-cyclohexadiene-1-carboxylate synthase [Bacillus sp. REN3]|uniref:2-succinyl-6-hydroxy-2, 4-cyclohexadiene-1-carboxylate synthase n=1 Tax=Bacillus sp. REN3 TaxID=2802440 RepID=UPI001AED20A6|nr:2-succinyl-6-hydroxy-2,4-cyclohexadiene-1-carboxylate synthase [Bacillus sp. REN3]